MDCFHICVIHDDDVFYVRQDGVSLSCNEEEAGTWTEGEASRLYHKWWEQEVACDVKLIYADPECNCCTQPDCPQCGHLNFV